MSGSFAIITDFAEGGSFDAALESDAVGIEQIVSILMDVLKGLQALHSVGKTHGHVKPSNILLNDRRDRAFLCDCCGLGFGDKGAAGPLEFGEAYAAKEAREGRAVPASDVFSLGVVLYEAVTGMRLEEGTPPWLLVRERGLDINVENAALASLIEECLQEDPNLRPVATDVINRLQAIWPRTPGEVIREIRFRTNDDPAVCSFEAKVSQTVGQALRENFTEARLYIDGKQVSFKLRVAELDPQVIYILRLRS